MGFTGATAVAEFQTRCLLLIAQPSGVACQLLKPRCDRLARMRAGSRCVFLANALAHHIALGALNTPKQLRVLFLWVVVYMLGRHSLWGVTSVGGGAIRLEEGQTCVCRRLAPSCKHADARFRVYIHTYIDT